MRIKTYRVLSGSRLGFRGSFLLVLAFIDIMYGQWMTHPAREQLNTAAFQWRDQIMPTQAWGAIWITAGVVIVVNAFLKQDRIGFATAVAIKFAWAIIAFVSGVSGGVPGAYTTVTVWIGVAILAIITAGWPEPIRSSEVTVMDEDSEAGDL